MNNLSKAMKERLNLLFNEAKWLYNYIVADTENRLKYETYKLKSVEIKIGETFGTREISHLSSQMKQAIVERIINNLKALKALKTNGKNAGSLRFKKYVNSIPLKQYGNTFKFLNEQKTKIKIQGIDRPIRVLGGHQIPKDCEIAKAELVRKPSGIYLHVTCYVDKSRFVEIWQSRKDKHGNLRLRNWSAFKTPVGVDFKPNGLVMSNGIKIEWRIEETNKLKKIQRQMAKKQHSSKNYRKLQRKLKREYERLKDIRTDVVNKVCSLMYRYSTVYYQDDGIASWHKGKFSKSIQYSAVGVIKARLRNNLRTPAVVLDRYLPTSKTCSKCGFKVEELTLSDRTYKCPRCGAEIDRDLNAAINMLRFVGLDRSEVKPAEWEAAVAILRSNPHVAISFPQ